ncbi:hypothetical protein ACI797_17390 [Geodermatophilus sp. SYSU D00691]
MTVDLTTRLRADARPVCGVEHEYEVRDAAGRVLDFRDLVDALPLGRRMDPGDPHAARGPWGGVVTADGAEAEVVTPPVAVGPGAPAEVAAWAHRGREFLTAALPAGTALTGYSTHVSVAVPDAMVRSTARLVVERFAPALMLLLDRASSPGLLVRPRPGRLEICGEHLEGRGLRHVVAVVVAVAGLCASTPVRDLPPRLRVRTEASRQRYGTYVDRTAFGSDLYAAGRGAPLRTRRGPTTAGAHLAAVVELLAPRLAALLAADDLADLRAVAAGRLPLPLEDPAPAASDADAVGLHPLDLGGHRAGDVRTEVVSATWWAYVIRVEGPCGIRWLTLPREWATDFFARLHAGRLDDVLTALVGPEVGAAVRTAPV